MVKLPTVSILDPITGFFQRTNLSKRQKIIISTLSVTIGFIISTASVNIVFSKYYYIFILTAVSYILSLWALSEGMDKIKAVILMILPVMFVLASTSFYFLLPFGVFTRFPIVIIFGLSFYALLLSQNVFNVAALRTIPLYRAASTVSFLFTLLTGFFLFNVIFAFNLPFYWNALGLFIISFPLIWQSLWTIEMGKANGPILIYTIILSIVMSETALALSFWPVAPTIWSLTLSAALYTILGIMMEYLRDRLTQRLVLEYIGVGVVVLLFGLFATSWGG